MDGYASLNDIFDSVFLFIIRCQLKKNSISRLAEKYPCQLCVWAGETVRGELYRYIYMELAIGTRLKHDTLDLVLNHSPRKNHHLSA